MMATISRARVYSGLSSAWFFAISLGGATEHAVAASGVTSDMASDMAPETTSEAPSYVLDLDLTLGGTWTSGAPDTVLRVDADGWWNAGELLRPQGPRAYPGFAALAAVEWQLARLVTAELLFDTGEIRPGDSLDPEIDGWTSFGLPLGEAFASGIMVRSAALALTGDRWTLALGRRRMQIADGLVFDDFATGAQGELELSGIGLPLEVELAAVLVGNTWAQLETGSALGTAEVRYRLGPFEHLGLFFARYEDRGGALAQVATSAVAEAILAENGALLEQVALDRLFGIDRPSSGGLTYVGTTFDLLPLSGVSLRAAAAVQLGHLDVQRPIGPSLSIDLRGFAAQAELHIGLGAIWDVGLAAMALSGDEPPRANALDGTRYEAFIGIAPRWTWSGLFFSGGLNQGFYASRATAAGVNGHGILGAGPVLTAVGEHALVEARLLGLRSWIDPPAPPVGGEGRWYGLEVDGLVDWRPVGWLRIAVELDVLFPGDFFPVRQTAYRFVVLTGVSYDG